MAFKEKLSKSTGINARLLPSGYQIIGQVVLLKLPKVKSQVQKKKIALAILRILPYTYTVCEINEVGGEYREPSVNILAGKNTETLHIENGIKYKIDVAKIMFSKGNLSERKRLIPQVKEKETIVDMFAGIGYFSLGLAKFTKAKEIIAIEKNTISYDYLVENIGLNNIKNITPINDDCRIACESLRNSADRIVMGYFPNTEEFLPYALLMAKSRCVIHFHNTYKDSEVWEKPLSHIEEACTNFDMKFEVLTKKKVKSYSPKTYHVVIDFRVRKV